MLRWTGVAAIIALSACITSVDAQTARNIGCASLGRVDCATLDVKPLANGWEVSTPGAHNCCTVGSIVFVSSYGVAHRPVIVQ